MMKQGGCVMAIKVIIYHDSVPSLPTRIARHNCETTGFDQQCILATPDLVRKLDLVGCEVCMSGHPTLRIEVCQRQNLVPRIPERGERREEKHELLKMLAIYCVFWSLDGDTGTI